MISKGRKIEVIILFIMITGALLYLFCDHKKKIATARLKIPDGFSVLFNGDNLDGWKKPTGNKVFFVEENNLVCSGSDAFPNVLFTEKQYENFILYLDFQMLPTGKTGNSGVLFHAPAHGRQSKNGVEIQIIDSFGQLISKNAAGAIYDLVPPDSNAVLPPGRWNHFEIAANWPLLKVTLNGVQVQNVDVTRDHILKFRQRIGFIGLQNHENPVVFRNIFIRELPSKVKYDSLFNGKNLDGWQTLGKAAWIVENGEIKASGGPGFLITGMEYQNFELLTYIKNSPLNYGGIFYRWIDETDPGYQAEFYVLKDALKFSKNGKQNSELTLPAFTDYDYLPFQIIAFNRQSEVRINGSIAAQNLSHQKIRPGKIAIFIPPETKSLAIKEILIRPLKDW